MADMFVETVETLHAFCLALLQREAPEYLKYEVLNEVQQVLFVAARPFAEEVSASECSSKRSPAD